MLRFFTAGESHGPALSLIVDGLPAGVPVLAEQVDADLRRRQGGHGRGGRMQIEADAVEILGGVRHGRSLGSPVAFLIRNRDHANWSDVMSPFPQGPEARQRRALKYPRPGHADLAGALKFQTGDLRDVLERASARETAARVAVGALARALLRELGAEVRSHVLSVGRATLTAGREGAWPELERVEDCPVRCVDAEASRAMVAEIDAARRDGDTVGGVFEVVVRGLPPGLGSFAQWDRRLDGRLAQQVATAREGAEELVVEVVAVGDDDDGRVGHQRLLHHARREAGHGDALAAALRVPDHATLALEVGRTFGA